MAKRDFYEILGVAKNADADTIKKAYRKVAMQYHPDRNPGDKAAEDKFKEAAEAYEILSDNDKRARYDRLGHAGVDGNSGFGGGNVNMDDIFQHFGDIFGDGSPFGNMFGGSNARSTGQRGTNIRIKIKLTLEDIAHGVTKKIKVKKQVTCTTCSGSGAKDRNSVSTCTTCRGSGFVRRMQNTFLGQMQTTTTCTTCNGTGQMVTAKCNTCKGDGSVYGEEAIDIEIPAGVEDGMQLKMSGKGNVGIKGAAPGDLLISIEEEQHPQFQRDGMNLVYDLGVNFVDATLGTSVEVPTIDGRVKVKIPAGTQSGKIFRLREKGLPSVQAYGKGDLLIQMNVWTPKNLTPEETALLEKLRNNPNFQPQDSQAADSRARRNSAEGKGFFDRMKDMFG